MPWYDVSAWLCATFHEKVVYRKVSDQDLCKHLPRFAACSLLHANGLPWPSHATPPPFHTSSRLHSRHCRSHKSTQILDPTTFKLVSFYPCKHLPIIATCHSDALPEKARRFSTQSAIPWPPHDPSLLPHFLQTAFKELLLS